MKETKYNLTFDFIEKTTANIMGGYSGLKFLFDTFIFELKGFGREINHTNFQNFIDGKKILIGTPDNYSKSGSPYEFEMFYERMFKFEYTGEGSLADKNNILEKVITKIDAIFSKENFLSDNEKKTNLKKVLLIISNEIKKSEKCKEIENPKLYPKLIYIKDGYIKTYNTIFDLYSDYLKAFEKVDFKINPIEGKNIKIKNKVSVVVSKENIQIKEITDFISNVNEKTLFLNNLKDSFKTEKGKRIMALIILLKKENVLIIPDRELSNFVKQLSNYFDRDIGAYSGINVKFGNELQQFHLDDCFKKLEPIIKKYKKI